MRCARIRSGDSGLPAARVAGAAVRWIVDAAAAAARWPEPCRRWPGWSSPLVAGVAAYLVGWPAWQAYRAREARDTNTERYLAWRGRADRAWPARACARG